MSRYSTDSHVFVQPFSRQPDGDEVVIGVQDSFIALPGAAVDLLDWLATGKTVGEAQALYAEKHHEQPDMEDFLSSLEQVGFVQPQPADGAPPPTIAGAARKAGTRQPVLRYHFENLPQPVARVLTSWGALGVYGAIIAAALAAIAAEPALWPRWNALLFTENMTPIGLALMLYSFWMLFLHEMAHLVAARAAGVPSRLGLGHRLWIVVAETDVSQLWTLPRARRYMPLLAGPLFDLTAAAVFVCIGFAGSRGWLPLPPLAAQVCRALTLMHLLNLVWQCNFFLRTDFYFVLANVFACKNLMGDTEAFLRTLAARWLRWGQAKDISYIPARELRVVRGYAAIWILGRANMLWILVTITLPLMWGYLKQIATILGSGFSQHPFAFIDALLLGTITVTVQVTGLGMWLRSFLQQRKGGTPHEVAA
ncbi:MAG TPA: hypothetical protein VF516_33770, partial [Kofleriaceae bacterium]